MFRWLHSPSRGFELVHCFKPIYVNIVVILYLLTDYVRIVRVLIHDNSKGLLTILRFAVW